MITFKHLTSFGIHATDGDIGGCKDILFDDQNYVVRYFVADTHKWLPLGRKVVLSPISLDSLHTDEEKIYVNMTKDGLKQSPSIDDHKPVSREYEEVLFKYFGYGYYWVGPGAWGDFSHPTELVDQAELQSDVDDLSEAPVNHLRACDEIRGYEVSALGEDSGHISDFIFDTTDWTLRYLVIDTKNWLPGGKHLLLPPSCIEDIDWSTHKVKVRLGHDDIMKLKEFDDDKAHDTAYLAGL